LDFKLFKSESSFYSRFHISEDTRHFIYTDKMEFHVIELPKLPKENSGELLLWAKLFAAEKKEEFEELAGMNQGIKSAYQRLQVISQDDAKRREYDARMKALRDYNQGMLEMEERGIEKGRAEGSNNRAFDIAKNMLSAGFDVDMVAQMTNLTESQMKKLRD
jgi:predicted transposase/invertase (TIGR01784 family)